MGTLNCTWIVPRLVFVVNKHDYNPFNIYLLIDGITHKTGTYQSRLLVALNPAISIELNSVQCVPGA